MQIEEMENLFNKKTSKKQLFDIVAPCASYISEAFTNFVNSIDNHDRNTYKDILIYKAGYHLTDLDKKFVEILKKHIEKMEDLF